jgi:CubicO group peptidase (beta-lactamase class C family)
MPAARALPTATPESVGISSERLARLHKGMQAYVDRKEVGGIVTLIARDGKVVDVHASGFQDVEAQKAMHPDTIFRIASMTKPITSVAVMMLQEEGRLLLTDPVSKFIPAFKGQRVIGEGGATVPARREMTVRDLLSHRSGLSYGFLNGGPVGDAYRKEGVPDGLTSTTMTLEEGINKLAAQPLLAQPGAAWNYSLSVDVLGRIVEVVSGMSFDRFLQERIFAPLGMTETSFEVADARWSRMATVYAPDGSGGIRPMKDPESFGNTHMSPIAYYKAPKRYFSGGAGLTSTARDYARFGLMLANGGVLDGVRLLSPKTLELMTASHTADLPAGGLTGPGAGFGLGFRVVTDVASTQTQGSAGVFGWSGIYGTTFWVDPKERLVAVMMVQRYPGSPVAAGFQPLVYQALTR